MKVHYQDLKEAILTTVNDVKLQMSRLELIMDLLDSVISSENCAGVVGLIDHAFALIKSNPDKAKGAPGSGNCLLYAKY